MVEIHTTIRNGLKVIARGSSYQRGFRATHTDPEEPERYEEIDLFRLSGYPCRIEMTEDEYDRIQSELFEAGNEQRIREG